jgi:hypothetical protein
MAVALALWAFSAIRKRGLRGGRFILPFAVSAGGHLLQHKLT